MLLSDYLHLGLKLDNYGVFDPDLEADSHFFINLQRLKQTKVSEFRHSYEKIQNYFRQIIKLLEKAKSKDHSDIFYRQAIDMFKFSEVNGICLGYAKGQTGAGFGNVLRKEVISTAYEIVKAGVTDPEFFELLPLFQKKVGADRLSDMIATLILEDIKTYTQRINQKFRIDEFSYPNLSFHEGYLVNPYKKDDVLLLPLDILHELPVVSSWEDIDNVIESNVTVRAEVNESVAEEWKKHTSEKRKEYLKRVIFTNTEVFFRINQAYKKETVAPFTKSLNFEYEFKKIIQNWSLNLQNVAFQKNASTSLEAVLEVLDEVKQCIENNRGWEGIQSAANRNREKVVQTFIQIALNMYNKEKYWDISREPDAGRGPVDFKLSHGEDKTVIEVKLSTNSQYIHGFTTQVREYAKAERTENMVYVLIDLGHPRKVEKLHQIHDKEYNDGGNPPNLIVIDATPKKSASIC